VTLDGRLQPSPKTVEDGPERLGMSREEQVSAVSFTKTLGTPTKQRDPQVPQPVESPATCSSATRGDPSGATPSNFSVGRWAWQPTYQTEGHIYAQVRPQERPEPERSVSSLPRTTITGRIYVKGIKDGLGERRQEVIVMEQSYEGVTDPDDRLADRQTFKK